MQRGDHAVDVRPVGGVFVGLLLEGAAVFGCEVADRSLVEVALGAREVARQEGRLDLLDVDVEAEIRPVHRDGGEAATGGRRTGEGKDLMGQTGVDHRRVLDAVVQGHALHDAAESLAVHVLVEAELERGLGVALGADESLLPDADLGVCVAVHGHPGREPGVDVGEWPGEAVPLDLGYQILERAGLVAQGFPVLARDLDGDVQHAFAVEVAVAGVGGSGVLRCGCARAGGRRGGVRSGRRRGLRRCACRRRLRGRCWARAGRSRGGGIRTAPGGQHRQRHEARRDRRQPRAAPSGADAPRAWSTGGSAHLRASPSRTCAADAIG